MGETPPLLWGLLRDGSAGGRAGLGVHDSGASFPCANRVQGESWSQRIPEASFSSPWSSTTAPATSCRCGRGPTLAPPSRGPGASGATQSSFAPSRKVDVKQGWMNGHPLLVLDLVLGQPPEPGWRVPTESRACLLPLHRISRAPACQALHWVPGTSPGRAFDPPNTSVKWELLCPFCR